MDRLTRFSLKNPSVIIILMILIIFGGVYSAFGLKTEAMPDISIPYVIVTTTYPGASPDDVLQTVTKPLEKATSAVKGLKVQESRSMGSVSLLILQYEFGVDMGAAESNVQKLVDAVNLPEGAQKSKVSRVSFSDSPILVMSVTGGENQTELEKTIQDKVQPELAAVNGVGKLEVQGLRDSNIYVKVDPNKLKSNGITLDSVKQALLANNISLPAGDLDVDQKSVPLQVSKEITTLDDVKNIPIVVLPNATQELGNGLGQMGQAVSGLAQGMGSLGQGMQQLGQGTQQIGQGTALVAQIQLTQMQLTQLQSQLEGALKAGTPANSPVVTDLQAQIKQQSTILAGLNQSLVTWLKQQQANAPKTTSGSVLPSGSITPHELRSSELQIKTVPLSEIADITSGSATPSSYTRTDNKTSIVINIIKDPDANTVQVANDIQAKIANLKSNIPQSIQFSTLYDQSKDIKASINGMLREALLGALFAVIVIALFLKNFKATIVAVFSIPLSVLIALILLPRFNVTLNMMTIGGLAVAVGRVVDDSIVVIENLARRISLTELKDRNANLVWDATKEVSTAITSSTITTVAVFAPLAMVSGIISKFFFPFALTVVLSLLASLLVAVTIVPLFSRYLLLNSKQHEEREGLLQRVYKKVLTGSLKHRWIVVVVSIALMGLSVWMTTKVPIQFIPADPTKALNIKMAMAPGTSLENTNQLALKTEKILAGVKAVKSTQDTVGDSKSQLGMNFNVQGSDHAKFMVVLNEDADVDQTISEIREKLKVLEKDGVEFRVNAQTTTAPSDSMELIVNGPNLEAITQGANVITETMKDIPDFVNIDNNLTIAKPQISVKVDAKKAGEKGYSPIMVAGMVRYMLTETSVTTISQNDQTVNVMMSIKQEGLDSVDKIGTIQLQGMNGNFYLRDVATIQKEPSPVSITQRNQKQFANITADILGHDTQGVTKKLQAKIDSLKLPEGVTYSMGGSNEQIQEGFSQMGVAIAVAVALVYLVMVIVFGGALVPLSILFSLPFAATGGLIALFITHQSLSMPAMIGMLMLIGIVVTNAIVLIDRVQTNRKQGLSVNEALIEAGSVRLRPILMTAIATVMALLPLASGLSGEGGTLISVTLGVVVIGGLSLSTLLTLIVVPVAYSFFESLKKRLFKNSTVQSL